MPSLRKKADLRPYQVYMAKKVKGRKSLLLAAEMGLGKTAAVLTAVRRLLDEGRVHRVLIVAPKYVAQYTWPEEIAAWSHTKVLQYSLILGNEKKRLAALNQDTEIHIINRENYRWLWRTLGPKKWKWDMLVYDESSRLKGGTKRTAPTKKGGRKLSEFGAVAASMSRMDRVVELTGTPAPNGLEDLWGQAYILDRGERLGATKSAFYDRWFTSDYMGYTHTPKDYAHREVMERMSDVMVGLRSKDHLDLPPAIHNIIKVNLPPATLKEYKRFERTLVSEAYDVEAVSKGDLTNKLLQFCNGSMYRKIEESYPEKREIIEVHDAKIAALESVVEEAAGSPILLAYGFQFDLEKILKKYPKAVTPKNDTHWKSKWDKGQIGILAVHPQSVGHGMNLQFGGHISCWYGLTWSLEVYQQFNERLPRSGQTHPFVTIHHIVAEGTVESDQVLPTLRKKDAVQQDITDAVRVRILESA